MNPTDEPDLESIRATFQQLTTMVKAPHLDESDRATLLCQLKDLQDQVEHHFQNHGLPDSFHAVLQQTEAFAVSRLGDDTMDTTDFSPTWKDFRQSLTDAVESWEAKHPILSTTIMNLASNLSKVGI